MEASSNDGWSLFGADDVVQKDTTCESLVVEEASYERAKDVFIAAFKCLSTRGPPEAYSEIATEAWVPGVLQDLRSCHEALQFLSSTSLQHERALDMQEMLCQSSTRAIVIVKSQLESRAWRDPFEILCLVYAQVAAWAVHESHAQHRLAIRCIDSAIIFEGASESLLYLAAVSERNLPLEPGLPDEFPATHSEVTPTSANLMPRFIVASGVENTNAAISDQESLGDLKKRRLQQNQVTEAELRRLFLQGQEAIVLEGAVSDWPALVKWRRLDYWALWASRLIPIEISDDRGGQESLTFGEFLAHYMSPSIRKAPSARLGYLAQHLLFDHLPKLHEDFHAPQFCPSVVKANAWIGTSGTVTRLHTDGYDNCFVQVCGFKFVRLIRPSDSHLVYPYVDPNSDLASAKCNHSHVDAENPDLQRHPLFASASPQDVVLGPGDCLFIPKGWWHYVRGLTPSISISLTW